MELGKRQTAVEKVPFELWDAIFTLACAKSDDLAVDSSVTHLHHRPHPPYPYLLPIATFSQVCSKWREVATSIPQLWTDIYLEVFNENQGPVNHWPNHNLLYSFLDNSAGKPLTVNLTLHIIKHGNEGHLDVFTFLVHLFLQNSNRWKAASIFLAFGGIDKSVWSLLDNIMTRASGFPILECLAVTLGPQPLLDPDLGTVEIPSFLWKHSPELKRLAITMEQVDLPNGLRTPDNIVVAPMWILQTGIPYTQLTHLLLDAREEGDLTWTEIHMIFSLAPNLTSLRGPTPTHPIQLDQLRHLYFQTPGVHPYDSFIACEMDLLLITPRLKTLAFVDEFIDWTTDHFHDFMTHFQRDMEELYLAMPENSVGLSDLLEALEHSPNLKTLHFDWGYETNGTSFTARMAEWDVPAEEADDGPDPGFRICPQLEVMSLRHEKAGVSGFLRPNYVYGDRDVGPEVKDIDNFADMLKKRCLPPNGSKGCLKILALPSDVLGNMDIMDRLNRLRESPWNLEIVENATVLDMRSMWKRYGGCD